MINSSALLSLAPELSHRIGMELEAADVKQLRLTCKEMAALLEPCIYRTLSLSINRNNMHEGVRKLEALATSNHPARYACRILFIGSLSPSYDPLSYQPRSTATDSSSHEELTEVFNTEGKLVTHLFDALTSLRGVQYVKWSPIGKGDHVIHHIVMNSLKVLPSLRRLEIVCADCDIPLELDDLRGLDEISISTQNTSRVKQALILDNVAKAISHNPNLTSIDVCTIRQYGHMADKSQSLHQLFKYYPTSASPLRLRNLRLQACLTRFDEITMPHLVHLTSLILLDVDDPFSGNHLVETCQHSNPDVLALFKERKRYGSCTKDIWNALTAARVRLEKIVIDNIPQSFLDYLLSYSGLKKLCLIYPGSVHSDFSDGKASDAMAALLFEQSLSNHARSLENLNIYAAWEGLWCFGGHNRNAISNLTKLKNLGMSVRSSDLWNYRDKRKDKNSLPKRDPIHDLLDMTAHYMPDITTIRINPARRRRTGPKLIRPKSRSGEKIKDSVENYEPPPGCRHIRAMNIDSGVTIYVVGTHSTV